MDEQKSNGAGGGDNTPHSGSNGAAATGEASAEAETTAATPSEQPAAAADAAASDTEAQADEPAPEPTIEEKLAAAEQALNAQRDKMLRVAADFDNFRKRSARDVTDARKRGQQNTIKDLLPVFDNLERALTHGDDVSDAKVIVDGLRMVHKQFLSALGKLGMERVEALGQTFDPALHDSIQHMHSDEHPAGAVMAVLQPGYRMGEMLVRPAMVVVSKGPAPATEPAAEEGGGDDAAGASETAAEAAQSSENADTEAAETADSAAADKAADEAGAS